jgi:3-oxoacyl-[acyl-carrier-protein] synthase-3
MKVQINGINIKSISSCIPKNVLNLEDLRNDFGESEVNKIIKTTGITSVRMVDDSTTTADLCEFAANKLIEINNVNTEEIDALIFVSQTADYKLPQTSHILQSKLNLKVDTICFDFPIGCNGYIYGLFQASILINSKACKKVLLLSGDTTTKVINNKDRSLKMVFGDGGSATLIEEGTNDLSFIIYSDGSQYKDLIIPEGGSRSPYNPQSNNLNYDDDGNARSPMNLFMDGMAIFNFAIKRVPPLIDEIITYAGWNKENVDLFALHQANKFMIDYLRKKCKISIDKMPVVVDGIGNTGPASIPILLTESVLDVNKLNKVVLCGFGVGLSWGALTCNLSNTKIIKTLEY